MKRKITVIAFAVLVSLCATTSFGKWDVKEPVKATWTNATAQDTTVADAALSYASAVVSVRVTGSITAGVIKFEGSDDYGTNWYPVRADTVGNEGEPAVNAYSDLALDGTRLWRLDLGGLTNVRARLSTAITGSGSAAIQLRVSSTPRSKP